MPEDLHAQIVHHPLPDVGREQRAAVLHDEVEQQRREIQAGQQAEQAQVAMRAPPRRGRAG